MSDINEKISQRGFVLYDGQVLETPLTDVIQAGVLQPKVVNVDGRAFPEPIKAGELTEVFCEPEPGEGDIAFKVPVRRDWREPQRDFFRLENPYQMVEDSGTYTWSHLMTLIIDPYLSPGERIAGILHGEKDDYYFYCPCHQAEVVYTTRHRFVCMGCGATHMVLRQPLLLQPKRLLTAEEWVGFFDDEGRSRFDEIGMSIVDFQDVENAETIWTTDQWDDAKHRFVFFARSSPEEIAEAIRGTEADPSIFAEAGWTPVDTSPPPAHQVADDSIDVDLVDNAAHALYEGVASFLSARTNSGRLVNAIPQLFRAVELLLKARLRDLDPNGLADQPNNPTVLKRIQAHGVAFSGEEVDVIKRLRRLRNDLQHGAAKFNYRTALAVSSRTVMFLDRFAHIELGLWIGDVMPHDLWYQLLDIREIASTAEQVVDGRLEEARRQPGVAVSMCSRCGRNAMLRPHPKTGASCAFCHHVPVIRAPAE